MGAKVARQAIALIRERADEECGGNFSEMVRRLLKYALTRMPMGWK